MKTLDELIELGRTEEGKDKLCVMLAGLVGWTEIQEGGTPFCKKWWGGRPIGIPKENREIEKASAFREVPNYHLDLNACRPIEVTLPLSKRDTYWNILCRITQRGRMATVQWTTTTAKPVHRTIALILTLQPK